VVVRTLTFVTTFGAGVIVEVVTLVVVVVALAKIVVEVTIVEVESVETITGSCVRVMTAKKATPPGLRTSDCLSVATHWSQIPKYRRPQP
jgi:hypothetical protein